MKIVAIDFDGTLCTEAFPSIGEPIYETINLVKALQQAGVKTILWTCREGQVLDDAVKWCAEHGLLFDAVNDNLPEIKEEWRKSVRKVYCDFYIDDKTLNPLREELDFEGICTLLKNSKRPPNTLS